MSLWIDTVFTNLLTYVKVKKVSLLVASDSLWPHGLQPTRLPHPWDSPHKSTGVGCHCLLRSTSLDLRICADVNYLVKTPGSQLWLARSSSISLVFGAGHLAAQALRGLPLPLRWNSKTFLVASSPTTLLLVLAATIIMTVCSSSNMWSIFCFISSFPEDTFWFLCSLYANKLSNKPSVCDFFFFLPPP